MSTLSGEIRRLRRYLRDPDANIWSDALLLSLWAQVAHDLQKRTKPLETYRGLPATPSWPISVTHAWEWGAAGVEPVYRALRQQSGFTASQIWEVQQYNGLGGASTDTGTAFTHPWETFATSCNEPPSWPMPANFGDMRQVYHDREPIAPVRRGEIRSDDSEWKTASGDPWAYYVDEVERAITLYPRPSVTWADDAGTGPIQYVNGDPESTDAGTILYGEGIDTQHTGVGVAWAPEDDGILLYYKARPPEPSGWGDEVDYPAYMLRYVRYGVLARAYGANTDGRIVSLAAFWQRRYELGVKAIGRYLVNRSSAVRRGMRTPSPRRRHRHPRLPSAYPVQNP